MGCHFLLQCMKVKSESEVAQCAQLLVTPWTAAYQAPLLDVFKYLIFLNLSHCPVSFALKVKVTRSSPTLCDPTEPLYSPWHSPGQNTGVGSLSLLQGIFPTQGLNPGLPHCRRIFLPAEPQGKSKNTGVGSLSLLQQIFPTQESNWGLLHCRWILYQLSYEKSPETKEEQSKSKHSSKAGS